MLRLGEIQSGNWLHFNGYLYQLSSDTKCPECGARNTCANHKYAYVKWFAGFQRGVGVEAHEHVTVFTTQDEAIRYADYLRTGGDS